MMIYLLFPPLLLLLYSISFFTISQTLFMLAIKDNRTGFTIPVWWNYYIWFVYFHNIDVIFLSTSIHPMFSMLEMRWSENWIQKSKQILNYLIYYLIFTHFENRYMWYITVSYYVPCRQSPQTIHTPWFSWFFSFCKNYKIMFLHFYAYLLLHL